VLSEECILIDYKKLTGFAKSVFMRVGLKEDDALTVSEYLVRANLRGVDSHGVVRLPVYAERAKKRLINPDCNLKIIAETVSTAVIDGDNGFGQVVGSEAMKMAVKKAKDTGIGFIGVRNSNNFGAAALLAMEATANNMIGIVISNTSPAMAPWGGMDMVLGTNPLAVAVPRETSCPIVLDIATTVVARDKINLMAKEGKKIPFGWALDKDGNRTDDPKKAMEGSMLPFGEHKGYGLALVIDILAGVLTGSGFGTQVKMLYDLSGKSNVGHIVVAINISGFMELELFWQRLAELESQLKSSKLAPGYNEILMPGELEFRCEEKRKKEGIPLSRRLVEDLNKIAAEVGESLNILS
jgi:LDH2 family malate/lactate/ureidoglycolate dehydrogenase